MEQGGADRTANPGCPPSERCGGPQAGRAAYPFGTPLTPHWASPLPPNVKWDVRLLTPPPKACAFSTKEVLASTSLFSCGRPASPRSFQAPFLWQSLGLYRDPYSMGNPSFRTVVWLQAWYVRPPTNQLLRTSPDLVGPGTNADSSEKSSCIPSHLRQDGVLLRHTHSPPCLVSITVIKDHDFPGCPTHR